MRKTFIFLVLCATMPIIAQNSSFDDFVKQQNARFNALRDSSRAEFNAFRDSTQAEFDAFRRRVNEQYAEFMRHTWEEFPVYEAEKPVQEKTVDPVVYEEPEPQPAPAPQPQPSPAPKEEEKPLPKEDIKPLPSPKPVIETKPVQIAVTPQVLVVPAPQPAPEPIAPVVPKEEPYKKVSISYFGTFVTIGFPNNDNLKLRALDENAIVDAWKHLSDSRYDITIKTALDTRSSNKLCDWGYLKMLQAVTEKQYGKTNEAVLAQAFIMTQSGYRVRLGKDDRRLYLLVASQYNIFNLSYYKLDGTRFYNVSGDPNTNMHITKAKWDKEQSLSLQMTQLPLLGKDPTPKRTLTSKKGVTSSVCLNKNLIDFFNTYPQACFNGDHKTRWAAYANTPVEQSVKDMLYPPLKKTISGMSEKDAVGILLNWVQTAFVYGYDDKIWGGDRAFFAQETLYYPYSDCEDRAILFSRLVRDLMGLDVVLLYYPGHMATAVAFNEDVNGDWLKYKNRKYVVCDPTFINAGVGRTMTGMNNQEAQVIVLKP